MKHPTELLPDYALEDLSPEEARLIETHLGGCPLCRAELYDLRENPVRLAESVPQAPAPPGNWEKIQARLAREPADAVPAPPSRSVWQTWLVAASLLVAAMGLWWGGSSRGACESLAASSKRWRAGFRART